MEGLDQWLGYIALFVAGGIAGTLNVVAGGGSFLTLPILIFLGLPPGVANATNRVAIFLQNVGAVWSFKRFGVLDSRALLWAAIPATLGAVPGTWLALTIPDWAFQKTLAFLMIAVTIWTLWGGNGKTTVPTGAEETLRPDRTRRAYLALGIGFFLTGFYGGFIQAGVGFLLLAVTSMAGLDLVRGNAVKVLAVLCFTSVSLGIFVWQGKVDWPLGLCLAGGNVLGGLLGARLTVLKGHGWVKNVVTATILIFAVKLWLSS